MKLINKALFITLFIIGIFCFLYLTITNPNYSSYCYDGDDIIDDDLCISLEGDQVNMYESIKERTYAEWQFFMLCAMFLIFSMSMMFSMYGDY